MLTTEKLRIAVRAVVLSVVVGRGACHPSAAAASPNGVLVPTDRAPFVLSANSVQTADPLVIGDLTLVPEQEADALARSAAADPTQSEGCLQAGADWIRRSDDGTSLELKNSWGVPPLDQVLTAYCHDEIVLVGGFLRRARNDESGRRGWIFEVVAGDDSAAKIFFDVPFAVGSRGRYTLNEVRAIDISSRRILFAGTSERGEQAFLTAPFAVVFAPSARQ